MADRSSAVKAMRGMACSPHGSNSCLAIVLRRSRLRATVASYAAAGRTDPRGTSGRCVSAAKQNPHRPGIAPALGLRAGGWSYHLVFVTHRLHSMVRPYAATEVPLPQTLECF